jgi:preprotein translocase subunit SecE
MNRQDKASGRRQKVVPRDGDIEDLEGTDLESGADPVLDDDFDAGLEAEADVPAGTTARRGGTRTVPPRRTATVSTAPRRTSPRQFLHEVNVEMRKVVWPTRTTTINYSTVVIATLAILMALIFGLDLGFQKLAVFLFK